ncbi:MAG: hypothetical protein VX438_04165 [Planctomycetota bacterium]|nr:hypothetical protein [Planctomycetota bacterium]
MKNNDPQSSASAYQWQQQKPGSELINTLLDEFVSSLPFLAKLKEDLLCQTGTRLVDWVEHFEINFASKPDFQKSLERCGFQRVTGVEKETYLHPGALFPTVSCSSDQNNRIEIKVDSVIDFLTAHQLQTEIQGEPAAARRSAKVDRHKENHEAWVIEKHGLRNWEPQDDPAAISPLLPSIYENFMTRNRNASSNQAAFQATTELIDDSISKIGVNRTCDLFFHTERHYWQIRNKAARIQKARQDSLGVGWGNHDHHTYRSSRESFNDLVAILEKLGFQCRENFYAGAEAGWGAQVLEQPNCGLVVFADVDLTAEELTGDFAHDGLVQHHKLGTIGTWCALHGESFLQAGLHHLECQFDYTAARKLLKLDGIGSMDAFTDFEFLKQCFTLPEIWPVDENRIESLLSQRQISKSQADEFRTKGAVGSHLEILERNNGFKGFNQSGVSDIISMTDPRKLIDN